MMVESQRQVVGPMWVGHVTFSVPVVLWLVGLGPSQHPDRASDTQTNSCDAMAGLMTWFQVTCPKCTGHLQVRLPEGVTSVQCSQCKAVFAVQVQPVALMPAAAGGSGSAAGKKSRKRKKSEPDSAEPKAISASQQPRTLSAYNVFMQGEVAKVKAEFPQLQHREAFKLAAERWQASPMNPQNGGERFPSSAPVAVQGAVVAVEGVDGPENEDKGEGEGEGEGEDEDEGEDEAALPATTAGEAESSGA